MYDGSDWRAKHACSELDYHAIAQLCAETMKCRVVFFRLLEAVCVSWAQFPPLLPLGQIVCVWYCASIGHVSWQHIVLPKVKVLK